MDRISRFVVWICSKFTRDQIERIVKDLQEILTNRNPEVKLKDDFKEKHPNYRQFTVDPQPPLKSPQKKAPIKLESSPQTISQRSSTSFKTCYS